MAEARQREAWGHTSALLAMAANLGRVLGGKQTTKVFMPSDFDPFARQNQPAQRIPGPGNVRMLKDVFVNRRPSGDSKRNLPGGKESDR